MKHDGDNREGCSSCWEMWCLGCDSGRHAERGDAKQAPSEGCQSGAKQSPKLAHVLIDIAQADRRCSLHWGDEIEGELLDQLEALRSEARSMIEELTGCEWGLIAEGNL